MRAGCCGAGAVELREQHRVILWFLVIARHRLACTGDAAAGPSLRKARVTRLMTVLNEAAGG